MWQRRVGIPKTLVFNLRHALEPYDSLATDSSSQSLCGMCSALHSLYLNSKLKMTDGKKRTSLLNQDLTSAPVSHQHFLVHRLLKPPKNKTFHSPSHSSHVCI